MSGHVHWKAIRYNFMKQSSSLYNLTQFQLKTLNSCCNSIYRRIFGFHKWESGKEIHFLCERMDLIHLINKFKLKFFGKLNWSNNCILNCCLHLLKQCNNLCRLYTRYDACVGDNVNCEIVYLKFYEVSAARIYI